VTIYLLNYQVSVLDTSFVEVALLQPIRTHYARVLNALSSCSLDLTANDAKIVDCTYMRYIRVKRDGVIVWGGRIDDDAWVDSGDPDEEATKLYALDALGPEHYLTWRTIPRPAGVDFDTRTGAADDVVKEYVRHHAGVDAGAGRPFADVFVQADASAVGTVTQNLVGSTVYDHINTIANTPTVNYGPFWWGFVPHYTALVFDGFEFRTAYPLWGLDRTQGNGVNEELILSRSAGTVQRVAYKGGGGDHRNVAYCYGTGTGSAQVSRTRSTAGDIAAWGRRELWVDAGNYTTNAELDAEGDRVLYEKRARVSLTAEVLPGVLSLSNLGDKCTISTNRYGRTVTAAAVITALAVDVGVDGIETITPTMVTV
jgi:hypothetical protein